MQGAGLASGIARGLAENLGESLLRVGPARQQVTVIAMRAVDEVALSSTDMTPTPVASWPI